jgi:hypothetical protein
MLVRLPLQTKAVVYPFKNDISAVIFTLFLPAYQQNYGTTGRNL